VCSTPPTAPGRSTELLAELLVVLLGNAEQIGDDEERVGLGEALEHLEAACWDDAVELAVDQAPHELLVLLQASGGQ
jgi:hypothetical protein